MNCINRIAEYSDKEILIAEVDSGTTTTTHVNLIEEQGKERILRKQEYAVQTKEITEHHSPELENGSVDLLKMNDIQEEIWKTDLGKIKAMHQMTFAGYER